jgi:DNA adenine methylase
MTPIIRWAGSKRYLAKHLLPQFPKTMSRYVEPFCGSASLFFLLEPEQSILSDINGELINALSWIRLRSTAVMDKYESLPDDREVFYLVRALEPKNLSNIERAARFLYLNRLCFNGLYRTNKSGKFNVPYSGQRNSKLLHREEIKTASLLLKSCELRNDDFKTTISRTKKGDFLYVDPPYASSERSEFCEYDANSFGVKDIEDLWLELNAADQRGVKFMLSYTECSEISRFYKRWNSETIQVRRNIAGFAGHRKTATEVVIKNY